jgi:putative nucleotidyltransferase with HDIG domain
MNSREILEKLDQIEDLPTLPAIAMEVNEMLRDYNTSVKELSQTIQKDQALVPRILKLVNSAFFGFPSKISDISRAVVVLGFNSVRNVIISVSIIDAFSEKNASDDFDIKAFWSHSVAVAMTSKYLAGDTRLLAPEDAFTGGLLHDIGKVVLALYFQERFGKVWASARENKLSFYDAEKREIPITHVQIGAHLAKKWQLPQGLVDTIRYHHEVNKNASDLNMLMTVHVADIIVNSHISDSESEPDLSAIYPDAASLMKPQLETVSDWFPEVSEEIQSACEFFLENK